MSEFDICVLGGGPGGYAASLYAASAGLRVALVEKDKIGGTCLHRGCIPAKSLLQSAEVFRTLGHAEAFGFHTPPGAPIIDWPAVNKRKSGIATQLHQGLEGLLKRRRVKKFSGKGTLNTEGKVVVDGEVIDASHVIISSGSAPKLIPGMVMGPRVITSDEATNCTLESLPRRVAVIGGGVIGVEFASVYTDLGVETTLLEAMDHAVLPIGPDREIAAQLEKSLRKRGTNLIAGARVGELEENEEGVIVPFEVAGKSDSIQVDQVLVAIGRRPVTEDQGFAQAGVEVDEQGFIKIDTDTMQTTRANVYAIGDCVPTPGLAHVAYAEAVVAVDCIFGEQPVPVEYDKVPWVVYAHPEVAWSGMTEEQAKAAGIDYEVRKHGWPGNGRAMIIGETEGILKIIARSNGGPIIGFHLCGPWASELLTGGYYAVNWEATPADVGRLIHAHPSLSELIGESMITYSGRSLHG